MPWLKSFSGEGTLQDLSLLVALKLWDPSVLCTPPPGLSFSPLGGGGR